MIKFANKKRDLSNDVIITCDNVKTLGEKIALCATKNARRFAYGQIDVLYAKLQHDIFHKNTFSDGYDIAQESICFLCSYIGENQEKFVCQIYTIKKEHKLRIIPKICSYFFKPFC